MAEASTAVAVAEPQRRRAQEIRVVADPIPVLDTARFEHMQRIATVMARSNLIPDTLCFEKNDDGQKVALPLEMVTANCFLVVNQAVRWNMDPFAVAQCVSVVHGKLCYEGKLIAAVLEGKLGVELEYEISGTGENMQVVVTGTYNGKAVLDSKGQPKIVKGTVAEWKTDGKGSPWGARGGYPRMLRYRGAREWGRIHSPGLMLGVYGDDEMEDLNTRFIARTADDGGGPPEPAMIAANDDGGGPPVPNQEATATEVVDDGGGPPAPEQTGDGRGMVFPADMDNFPGDKPMKSEPIDDGIPEFLRRSPDKPPITDNERDWLESLDNAFSGCEDMSSLAEEQERLMTPQQHSVSTTAWNDACDKLDEHVQRVSAAG